MKPRIKFKSFFFTTLVISVICSIYLNTQILGIGGPDVDSAFSYGASALSDKLIFPEVEIVKVVLEKLVDIITIAGV